MSASSSTVFSFISPSSARDSTFNRTRGSVLEILILKRQLSNPKAGFITRVEKPNNRPSRDGALTEAGQQVQKRDGDKPRKSGE